MREPIDPEILRDALPPEVHEMVNQVTANVNRSVKELIDRFKSDADKTLEDFKQGRFPEALDKELSEITSACLNDVQSANDQMRKVQASAKVLADAAAAVPGMGASLKDLEDQTAVLNKKLTDMEQKVKTFGEKSGGAIATAAYKFFTGGIG